MSEKSKPPKVNSLGNGVGLTTINGRHEMAVDLTEHPFLSSEARSQVHQNGIDGYVYGLFLGEVKEPTGVLRGSALGYAIDLLSSMKPRDAMEKMLVSHALWCHGRIAKLNVMLANSAKVADVKILSELVDRASNDFRKAMLALAEYRRPRRAAKYIGQLNTAHQQVVQNGGRGETRKVTTKQQRALPPAPDQPRRAPVAEAKNSRSKAVARVDRSTKRRG